MPGNSPLRNASRGREAMVGVFRAPGARFHNPVTRASPRRTVAHRSGPVRDAGDAPGNVTAVAHADPGTGFRSGSGRNASCTSSEDMRTGVRAGPTRGCVRGTTHHLDTSCEASPQFSAPALVRTHQRQL